MSGFVLRRAVIFPFLGIVLHHEDGVEEIVDMGVRLLGFLLLGGGQFHHRFLMDGQFQDEGVVILHGTVQRERAAVQGRQAL